MKKYQSYPTRFNDIVRNPNGEILIKNIRFQKHMAHHLLGIEDFSWLKDFKLLSNKTP